MRGKARTVALVAVTVLVTVALHAAFASTTTVRSSTPSRITVLRPKPGAEFETRAAVWRNVPGARTKVTVPPGGRGLVVVRFAGQAGCASPVQARCTVRLWVGGKQAQPRTVGVGYVFVEARPGGNVGSYAVERSRGGLSPGTYTVRVQWRSTNGARFTLKNWHLAAEAFGG